MHSVIIPTAGDAPFLSRVLCSLLPQIDNHIEVIVVENGTQGTIEERVHAFRRRIAETVSKRVKYIHEPIPGLLAGRHGGIAYSQGEIISLFDDDVIVEQEALNGVREAFSEASVELVGGPSRPEFLAMPPAWLHKLAEFDDHRGFMMTFMSLLDLRVNRRVGVNPDYVFGQNFHIRRDTFESVRGFHPDLYPTALEMFTGDGETGLTRKLSSHGRRADYLDKVAVRHLIPASRMTVDFVSQRARYAGIGQAFDLLRHGGELPVRPAAGVSERASAANRERLRVTLVRPRGRPGSAIKSIRSEGREFLYSRYRESPAVRDWVHRADFMDYRHP